MRKGVTKEYNIKKEKKRSNERMKQKGGRNTMQINFFTTVGII